MNFQVAVKTDVGKKRTENEDFYGIIKSQNLLIICDGMGGHAAGDVASRLAVRVVEKVFQEADELYQPLLDDLNKLSDVPNDVKKLVAAIRLANRAIIRKALDDPKTRGMGTTIVAILFRDNYYAVCHVGDSRAYRIRDNNIEQLTVDHSWINELVQDGDISKEDIKNFKQKNVITRALGTRGTVKIDLSIDTYKEKDYYLLCSDGLCDPVVSDDRIKEIVLEDGTNIESSASKLVKEACEVGGGPDNVTVGIVYTSSSSDTKSYTKPIKITIEPEDEKILALEDKILRKLIGEKVKSKGLNIATLLYILIFIFIILAGLYIANPKLFTLLKSKSPDKEIEWGKNEDTLVTKNYGSLEIESDPKGCSVFIDDEKFIGKTPLKIDSLSLGPHFIKAEKEFFSTKTDTVEIVSSVSSKIKISWRPYGTIIIACFNNALKDKALYLNGIKLSNNVGFWENAEDGIPLPYGKYTITIKDTTTEELLFRMIDPIEISPDTSQKTIEIN